MKMKTMTEIKTKASLKDVVWAALESASEQLKGKINKSGLVEFDINGCKVEMIVRSPKKDDSGGTPNEQ